MPMPRPKANVADVSPGDAHTLASRLARLGASIIDGLIVVALVYTPIVVGGGMGSALGEWGGRTLRRRSGPCSSPARVS